MNLKDLLTSEGRLKLRIERNTKKLRERYAQHEVRMEAADRLKEIGTPEAIYALARRFSATSENLGIDQEEKKRVQDILIGFGERAVEPLKRYVRTHDQLTWAIDALRKLLPNERLMPFLLEVLRGGDPIYIRGEKANQILEALQHLGEPEVVPGVTPCLRSPDDTVRFAAVECLAAYGDERAREPLLEALTDPDEDSARVRTRIAEALEKADWDVKGYRKKVEAALPAPFRVSSKGRVVR
jgi:HEAT repeat protein